MGSIVVGYFRDKTKINIFDLYEIDNQVFGAIAGDLVFGSHVRNLKIKFLASLSGTYLVFDSRVRNLTISKCSWNIIVYIRVHFSARL